MGGVRSPVVDETRNDAVYVDDLPHSYGLDLRPIGMAEAGRLIRDPRRIIARTTRYRAGEPLSVSTVFLIIDHNYSGHGLPVLWETMIFGGPEELDQVTWRYTTREAALRGHRRVLAMLRDEKLARDAHERERAWCREYFVRRGIMRRSGTWKR